MIRWNNNIEMVGYEEIIKIALERGFYFPSCEIYADAPAGFWEYGPNGVNVKNNFITLWRKHLLREDSMLEIDGSQIMSKSVFKASGHLENFTDPIIKCLKCQSTYRADKFIMENSNDIVNERMDDEQIYNILKNNDLNCPKCKGDFSKPYRFNMMFKVNIGPSGEEAYLRPETCQTIFVDFSRIFKIMRGKLPLGIAQVGKSFRNEIAPRQSLLRLREFYQAEIEVFCNPNKLNNVPKFDKYKTTILPIYDGKNIIEVTAEDAITKNIIPNRLIAYYLSLLINFYKICGIDMERLRLRNLDEDEKAFYSSIAFDLEVETSIGWLELVACNYRTDYDLSRHANLSKRNLEVIDPSDQSKILPHVFELSLGIDRSLYSIMEHSYYEDIENERTILKLKPQLSPVYVGVLPLMTKDGLREKALEIYNMVKMDYETYYDESGSIGRRYRRLDEIGTPFVLTVDKQTLEDNSVTIRERDSMTQKRIEISKIKEILEMNLKHRD